MNTTRDPEAVIPAQAGIQKKVRPRRALYRLAKTSVVLFAFTAACTNAVESLGVLVGCLAPFVDLVEGNVETEPALAELLTVDEFADGHGGMVTVTWNHKHVDITTLTPASLGVVIAGFLSVYTGAPFHPPDPSATEAHELPLALFPSNQVHVSPPDVFDQVEVFAAETSSLHLVHTQGPDAVRAALEAYLGCDGSEEDEGRHDEVVVTVNTGGTIKDVDGNPLPPAVTSFNVYCAVDEKERPKVSEIDYFTVVGDHLDWVTIKENCTPETVDKGEECCNPEDPSTCSLVPPRAPIGINFDRAMERMTGVITRTDPNSNCSDLPLERDGNGNPIDPNTSECGASVVSKGEQHIILVGGAMEDEGKGWPVGARLNLVVPSRGSLFAQESYRSLRALLPNKLNAATNGWGPNPFDPANQPRNFFVSGVKIGSIIRPSGDKDANFNSDSTVLISDETFKLNLQIAQLPDPISRVTLTIGSTVIEHDVSPSESTIEFSPTLGESDPVGLKTVRLEGFTADGQSVGIDTVRVDWQPTPKIVEFKMVNAPLDQSLDPATGDIYPCIAFDVPSNPCPTAIFTKGFEPTFAKLSWDVAWAKTVDIEVKGPSAVPGLTGFGRTVPDHNISWPDNVQTGSYTFVLHAKNDRKSSGSRPIHAEMKANTNEPVITEFKLLSAPLDATAEPSFANIEAGSETTAKYVKGFDPLTSTFSYTVEWTNEVKITGGPFSGVSEKRSARLATGPLQALWTDKPSGDYNLILEAIGTEIVKSGIIKAKLEDPPAPSIDVTFTGTQPDETVQWTVTGCPSVATGTGGISRITGSFTSNVSFQPVNAIQLLSKPFWPSKLETVTRTNPDGTTTTEEVLVEKPITSRSFDSNSIGELPTLDIKNIRAGLTPGTSRTSSFTVTASNGTNSVPSNSTIMLTNSSPTCCTNSDCRSSDPDYPVCHFPASLGLTIGSSPASCGVACTTYDFCDKSFGQASSMICNGTTGQCYLECNPFQSCPLGNICLDGACVDGFTLPQGAPSRSGAGGTVSNLYSGYTVWSSDVCEVTDKYCEEHRAYDLKANFWDTASIYDSGSDVKAMEAGEVYLVQPSGSPGVSGHEGFMVITSPAKDRDVFTMYFHMRATRKPGDKVNAGDVIGVVDDSGNTTGPHVHVCRSRRIGEVLNCGNGVDFLLPRCEGNLVPLPQSTRRCP